MLETLREYDKLYIKKGCNETEEIFEFSDRASSLILTAPHATRSFCNKKEKKADLYTGAIVKYIGEINNVSTIIRTKYTPYKTLISDFIKINELQNHYFLDIHGFNQDIDYDICLGIGKYDEKQYPYVKEIYEIIKKFNLKPIINHPDYKGLYGLTGRYQKYFNKPNVIQIELKRYLRDFYHNGDTFTNVTLPLLNEIIKCYP